MKKSLRHRVVRSLLVVGACAFALALSSTPGHAKTDFGVRGGAYGDSDEPFLGAEVLFNVGTQNRWFGNPNVEHAFADNGSMTTASFDFHYDFPNGQRYTFWAGAGPTLIFRDQNQPGNDDSTDPGVNVLFGVGSKTGDVRPYGQMKVIVADDSQAVVGVGVRF